MSEKNYTPVEAARKVLEKCQEIYNDNKVNKAEEVEKCGEMKVSKKEKMKKEVEKCGETYKAEEAQDMNPKLKGFIEKRKAKKAAKMEKMMGIGEKAPVAPPAQSAAPVNAPKPSIGAQIGFPGIKKSEKK